MKDDASSDTCKFDLDELRKRLLKRGLSEVTVDLLLEGYPEGWRCNREVYRNGYCVFHSLDKPNDFEDRFWAEFWRAEREDEYVDFSGAIFPQMIFSFPERKHLELDKPVNFIGSSFQGRAYFRGAKFSRGAYFGGTEFKGEAYFVDAKFQGKADFTGADFQWKADFRGSEFKGEAYFVDAKFQGKADFTGADFQWKADFRGSEFQWKAHFVGTRFQGDAYFVGTRFHRGAYFVGARFLRRADFSLLLDDLVDLSYSTFNSLLDFQVNPIHRSKGFILLFHAVDLREPRRVTLTGFPLSLASFLKTDLTEATLVPSRGPPLILDDKLLNHKRREIEKKEQDEGDSISGRKTSLRGMLHRMAGGNLVFSSLLGKNTPRLTKLENEVYKRLENSLTEGLVLAEYKSLRKCLEGNKMFTEASGLFISEMRLARKRLSWRRPGDLLEKLVHYFYDVIARYGESLGRPLGLYLLANLIASIALGWTVSGNPDFISSLRWIFNNPDAILGLIGEYMWKVTAVSLQIRSFKDFIDMKIASSTSLLMIEIPLRVLSLVFLGSFFVALKRRLERK